MGRWSHTPVPPFQKSSSSSNHRPHPRSRRCTHTMHSLTCMSVVVCVVRKPRPCNSYSRRRDRINSVLWRSYYKGGGGTAKWRKSATSSDNRTPSPSATHITHVIECRPLGSASGAIPLDPPPPPSAAVCKPRMDSKCACGCTWSKARATARLWDSRPPE